MFGKPPLISRVARWPFWLQCTVSVVLSLCLYVSVIDNSFVSDDFLVLRKLVQERQLNTDGFFRPLSDISIYLTYRVFGTNPMPYYLTGVLLHALNAVLLLRFCMRWRWTFDTFWQERTAVFAALLFLAYPFHNESVAWVLGRGVLMADTFGILALLLLVSAGNRMYRVVGVGACYFIGLMAYESIIMLPAMVLLYVWVTKSERLFFKTWLLALAVTGVLHVVVRWLVSGSVVGDYGDGFVHTGVAFYIGNLLKAMGRLFLPPSDRSSLMMALTGVLFIAILLIALKLWKFIRQRPPTRDFVLLQAGFLMLAMLLPVLAGVSTRTSESDRFLHFPSYFLCVLVAFTIVHLIRNRLVQAICFQCLILAEVYFLEKNNYNWEKASGAVTAILSIIAAKAPADQIAIVNLPDEIDGAFVFRNGFQDALLLNKIDTATVQVVSRLTRDQELSLPPLVDLRNLPIHAGSRVVFWNRKNWVQLR